MHDIKQEKKCIVSLDPQSFLKLSSMVQFRSFVHYDSSFIEIRWWQIEYTEEIENWVYIQIWELPKTLWNNIF